MDRREEILQSLTLSEKYFTDDTFTEAQIFDAMDEYMKECVLEAFEYVVKNTTGHSIDEDGSVHFKFKGQWLSTEELFENFL
jgi:hypothetical protein